ncbi:protein of unknown function [Streptomyces sp. KY75]|nr:protein of unknown function [Streptomyces sp. KY75]CAD5991295.1 protein of unknown function [Streptomyces sp. KY70]
MDKCTLAMDITRSCAVMHHIPAAFISLEVGGFCLCLKRTATRGSGRPQGQFLPPPASSTAAGWLSAYVLAATTRRGGLQ